MKTIIIDGIEYNLTPKVLFKKGDWVVSPNGVYWHIDAINNNRYEVSSTDGACADWPLDTGLYHLWTIQDAKDGDVLYSPCCKLLWIYKDDNSCYVGNNLSYNENCVVVNSSICIPSDVCPATKEQRDTLIKAMTDAGYIFDFEKKELKKIEQKPVEWSEEDEQYLLVCKNALAKYQTTDKWDANIISQWLENKLKFLKPQPKQEWSEEDEEMVQVAINACNSYQDSLVRNDSRFDKAVKAEDWLKSLRPQNRWKPSDEQMTQLKRYCPDNRPLTLLYEQLKKLMEE